MSIPWFGRNLNYIAAVTQMLDKTDLPPDDDFYIHVELREATTHKKVGEWSDEIADDAWYFQETSDE